MTTHTHFTAGLVPTFALEGERGWGGVGGKRNYRLLQVYLISLSTRDLCSRVGFCSLDQRSMGSIHMHDGANTRTLSCASAILPTVFFLSL